MSLITELPLEILIRIFRHLPRASLYHVGLTCRSFYRVYKQPSLWTCVDWRPLGSRVTDDVLTWLSCTTQGQLRQLWLKDCPEVTSTAYRLLLEGSPRLTYFSVKGRHHFGLPALFEGTRTTWPCLHLEVVNATGMGDQSLNGLVQQFPNLQHLDLIHCHNIRSFQVLASLIHLESLDLSHNGVKSEELNIIIQRCSNIKVLVLDLCYRLEDSVIETIAAHLPQLRHLSVNYCVNITNVSVLQLDRCPGLEFLALRSCHDVTEDVLEYIASATALKQAHTPLGKWRFWA
ncbi:hypothetical protein IWQ62_000972 [Dispira parvispora]|uniref:F-box domain-containing protein n=1 Tax=Dispira parvispora TaxID=1520584 RepID=A0A9W8E8P3_9FUNG|nr:hypothetical protein IWQ62_000972 [Dispira parvispora]